VHEHLIGRETPIHVRKHDGSYHRRWPGRFVTYKQPLYLLTFSAGDLISPTPDAAGPAAWPARYGGEIYLFEDRWWNASRARRDGRTWYYVNIGTPAEFDGETFSYVDLDLDVAWYADGGSWYWAGERRDGGEPEVLDEDEFLAHSRSMSYPAAVIKHARDAVEEVLELIRQRAFPFDQP
jgi:protein associated with RNAse G/E